MKNKTIKAKKTDKSQNKRSNGNDLEIVSILFGISFFFGYILAYFDFTRAIIPQLSAFWFLIIPFAENQIGLKIFKITRWIFMILLMNLFFGSLFVIPEYIVVVLMGLSLGSVLPFIFSEYGILLSSLVFISTLIIIPLTIKISEFSIKIGRKIIALLLHKELNYDFKKNSIKVGLFSVIIYAIQLAIFLFAQFMK